MQYNEVTEKSELTPMQASFISGALRDKMPRKVLEVGTSAGGSTCLIMETLKELNIHSEISTVDLSETYYRDQSKNVGYLADDY